MQMHKRWIAHRIGQLVTASCLVVICSATAWAQVRAPRYGSGIAGHVVEGPTTPVCRPNVPCTRPFANATILVLDSTNRSTVGTGVIPVKFSVRGRDLGGTVEEAPRPATTPIFPSPSLPTSHSIPAPPSSIVKPGSAKARLEVIVPISLALIMVLLYGLFNSFRDSLLAGSGSQRM
jgi:hypothetical protein